MKTTQNNTSAPQAGVEAQSMITKHRRYQDLTLEASLHTACKETTEQAKIETESLASRRPSLPRATGDHMALYFEKFHMIFQTLIDKINADLQFQTTCNEVKEHEIASDHKTRDLSNKLAEARLKHIPIEEKAKNTPEPDINKSRVRRARLVNCGLSLMEGIFSIPVFESWGCNLIFSILLGLGLALIMATFAEMFEQMVGIGKTKYQKRAIVIGAAFITLALYYYLSSVRVDYLNKMMASLNMHYSPWPFVCMSELLLIVAVVVCYFNLPTRAQKLALREYEKAMDEKSASEQEIERLKNEIAAIHEEHSKLKNGSLSILVFGSMMEELVMNYARSCYALFKNHNLIHRADNTRPDCFDEEYPFTFTTNFHQVKLLSHHESNL